MFYDHTSSVCVYYKENYITGQYRKFPLAHIHGENRSILQGYSDSYELKDIQGRKFYSDKGRRGKCIKRWCEKGREDHRFAQVLETQLYCLLAG